MTSSDIGSVIVDPHVGPPIDPHIRAAMNVCAADRTRPSYGVPASAAGNMMSTAATPDLADEP